MPSGPFTIAPTHATDIYLVINGERGERINVMGYNDASVQLAHDIVTGLNTQRKLKEESR